MPGNEQHKHAHVDSFRSYALVLRNVWRTPASAKLYKCYYIRKVITLHTTLTKISTSNGVFQGRVCFCFHGSNQPYFRAPRT